MFSHIEHVLRIHLVKISLIFIKCEASGVHPKDWLMDNLFGPIRGEKIMIFHEFEKSSWDLGNTQKHTPGPLEKHRAFASFAFM